MGHAAGERVVAHVADVAETGVAGLVLSRTGPGGQWRLVHEGSGLLVSRSAVSDDRRALVRLAQQLAPLADWSATELSLPGPALRQAVEAAAQRCGLSLPPVAASPEGDGSATDASRPSPVPGDDLVLLRRVVRLVHGAVPPGVFASAIAELDRTERARLRELILGTATDAVVKPIPTGKVPLSRTPRRVAPRSPGSAPGPGSATG